MNLWLPAAAAARVEDNVSPIQVALAQDELRTPLIATSFTGDIVGLSITHSWILDPCQESLPSHGGLSASTLQSEPWTHDSYSSICSAIIGYNNSGVTAVFSIESAAWAQS